MSIYSAFIYEKHNLLEYTPCWMSTERYDYCEQSTDNASSNSLLGKLSKLFRF